MIRTDDPPGTRPRAAAIDHGTAMRLAATEYARTVDAWDELSAADWDRPTDCPDWTVLSWQRTSTAWPGWPRHPWRCSASRRPPRALGGGIDALTAHQVDKFGSLAAGRARRRDAPGRAEGGQEPPTRPGASSGRAPCPRSRSWTGSVEPWTIGFLTDVILTRDPWMHRVDLARATGREMVLTADHDGVIVDDVVREWAARHGQPYRLILTGPAGGDWSAGQGGEVVEMDAIEFCRVISGREEGVGLLATQVPF